MNNINPELLKKLIITFSMELEEQSQVMTDGLLALEKNVQGEERKTIIASIFRAAHNIKGASRGIGINDVGEISHRIESLFSAIQKHKLEISKNLIDLSLEAVDKMHVAMQSFVQNSPPTFDLADFIQGLDAASDSLQQSPPLTNMALEPEESKKTNHTEVLKSDMQDTKPKHSMSHHLESNAHETIRVSIEKIDKVSSLMEEIQVNKIAIDDYYSEINRLSDKTSQFLQVWKKLFQTFQGNTKKDINENFQRLIISSNDSFSEICNGIGKLDKNMKTQINELSMITNSLQDEVRSLRLVPASYLFSTLPRYVRDLSHELKKVINLDIRGSEVSMDNLILEGLRDPLMHLMRNAIDHGIEDTETRKKLGKPSEGTIKISITDRDNQIIIDISDDGAGIDIKEIANAVEEKNLASRAELNAMNDDEIIDFIFRPGFSTKEIITSVSGRGVGLDVVKDSINHLKGDVVVKTELGKGTIFSLHLPLTLSGERGLLVNVNNQLFVIPTSSVERVLTILSKDVVNVEGTQAILLDRHPIPLRSLAVVLGLDTLDKTHSEFLSLVVIKNSWNVVALVVDEIIGEREIVIKPLNKPITHLPCISGGTLLERSQVVIVLNSADVISKSLHANAARQINIAAVSDKVIEKTHILVVDDSITTRTLEKNILESKNYKVTVAVNGKEAWDLLQKEKFALLITDINMPIMDGFVLTKNVKQNDKLRNMPVVIVTSLGSDAEKIRGIEAGADAYIVKNEFESDALLQIVSQLV